MTDPVIAFLETEHQEIVKRLLELVRIPSVSTDPAYASSMAQARDVLARRLRETGIQGVHEIDADGHPAVYGEWLGATNGPTILLYGHYDVQPPDPLDKWKSPPFTPEIRDDRIYGRGVSDDKGPLSIALETLAAFLAIEGTLPVNIKILLEGEEELGSPTLAALCQKHTDLLRCDAVLSADGASWRHDLPTVNVGTRGNAGFEFSVETASKDLHSGRFGGAVPNALHVMASVVAGLHDADGSVAVPGFYEGVRTLGMGDRTSLAAIPFDESGFYSGIGSSPVGEPGYSTLERLWLRPCLDVNGMWGGYTGPGGKTVIPNEAHAKITIRVVPWQDPEQVCQYVKDFLRNRCPAEAMICFGPDRGRSAAYELPVDHPLLHAAAWALQRTYETVPHRVRIGGTLPIADIARRELGVDTVMFSFSMADDDFHAPNEFFRLSSLDNGLRAWTMLLRRLRDSADGFALRRPGP
jgi:acetylornithine deacetylase/succinyl-diaminopimelate desuccinylase-like protein